jgi:hypothetical protein
MKAKRFPALGLVVASVLLMAPGTVAQDPPEGRELLFRNLEQLAQRFPEERRRFLSSGALNIIHLAERQERFRKEPGGPPEREELTRGRIQPLGPAPAGFISDPSSDFILSRLAGFTQSETSTAWCGSRVVVGFNDSGSLLETLPLPFALSFNGVARSNNMGASFVDLGFLNGGPNFFDMLAGDPVVVCADPNRFFYSSLFETFTPPATFGSAISVSRSFDGGLTWGFAPIVAVSKNGLSHFLDKDWMAIDSTNTNRLYVTYTDFDDSGLICGTTPIGDPIPRTAIELVRSTNGGTTWSAPLVIDEVCGNAALVQGSQVAVGPAGEVYVAWERYVPNFVTRSIQIKKSVNNGVTFGSAVKVDDVTCIGGCFTVRAGFRAFLDLQSLAVDRSGTPSNGHLYVAWHDGRNLLQPDLLSDIGFYGFGDVLVSRSTNGGMTWSAPVRVNRNVEPLPSGEGSDQFMPGIAVDKDGDLGICWYDRRRDPRNYFVDRWCATSTNGGGTWSGVGKTLRPFPPIHATDDVVNPVYMGDYDTLVSDFTKANRGFIGAFQFITDRGNPDVKTNRLH